MDDSVPTEENIEWAVTRLQNHRSGGPSGLRADHQKRWLAEGRNKEREVVEADHKTPMEGTTKGTNVTAGEGT